MNLNSELVRLHKLHEERILSAEEYETAKRALIVRFAKQPSDRNRSDKGVRIVSLIFGIVLAIFGLLMSAGALLGLAQGDEELSKTEWIVALVFMGILPTAFGLVLCFRRHS